MDREAPSDSAAQADWMIEVIAGFCGSAHNSLGMPQQEPAFAAPLVGFAAGDDPLFAELKRQFFTGKSCNPHCTVGCVRTCSAVDVWRTQTAPA